MNKEDERDFHFILFCVYPSKKPGRGRVPRRTARQGFFDAGYRVRL